MSPAEFRAIRESLALSTERMGWLLHVGGRQVRRYEAGRSNIPPLVARVTELLDGDGGRALSRSLRDALNPAAAEIPPGPTQQGKGEENTKLGEGSSGDGIIYG